MNTCVVAIHGIEYCSNFKHLPQQFIRSGVRFVIHTDPVRENDVEGEVTNYDLLLDVAPNTVYVDADFISGRPAKSEQAKRLQKWAVETGAKHFIAVKTLNKTPSPMNPYDFHTLSAKVLIKSEAGARGLGHIIFDTRRGSMFKFLCTLRQANEVGKVKSLLEEYEDCIEFHSGFVNDSDEPYRTLTEQEVYVCELIEGIENEVRLITDMIGEPRLIKLRKRYSNLIGANKDGSGYLQASGANQDNSTNIECIGDIYPQYKEEILRFLKKTPKFNSIDLFFTAQGWGVFEYCNQFGTEAYSIEETRQLHKDLIFNLYLGKYSITVADYFNVNPVGTTLA